MKKQPVWTEIDLNAISHNLKLIKSCLNPNAKIMAVVKANAYGHGAVKTAQRLVKEKIDYLGVGRPDEALELRKSKITAPILIFGYTPTDFIKDAVLNSFTLTIYDYHTAKNISDIAASLNARVRVHIKIDTGMGRLGFFIPNLDDNKDVIEYFQKTLVEIQNILKLKGLIVEGLYTHFASADVDMEYSKKQASIFRQLISMLVTENINFDLIHTANSAAIFNLKDSHMNMVRVGLALYGIIPYSKCTTDHHIKLKPAMTIKALVAQVKDVPAETKISYGSTYTTATNTKIATIPIGYADGYKWQKTPKSSVLIKGQKAPVVGSICMDFLMADVGHIKNVQAGDEVVILGSQKDDSITASALAITTESIPYEIISSLTARMPRIYV